MVAFALRKFKKPAPLKDAGSYSSYTSARRALKRTGYETLDAWVDSWGLKRVPHSMILPGDLVAFKSEDDAMPALALTLSNGRFLGFVPEVEACAVFGARVGHHPLTAWAV